MAKRSLLGFHDALDLPGPLRLIVTKFREYCTEVQLDDLDADLKAAQIVGAASMAGYWLSIYAGFVFAAGECHLALNLIQQESKVLVAELTKPSCPHARQPHATREEERRG